MNEEPGGLNSSLRSVRSLTTSDGADRLRMIAYAPAMAIIVAVLAIELGVGGFRNTAGSWLPLVEVFSVMAGVLAGTLWFGWGQSRVATKAMMILNNAEDERRTISAIGVGSSWDLDINRIFARFSNDLTALIDYDRLTITTARRDGRMQLEFIAGVQAPEDEIGGHHHLCSRQSRWADQPQGLRSQLPDDRPDGRNRWDGHHPQSGPKRLRPSPCRNHEAGRSPNLAGYQQSIHYQESQHRAMERTALAEIGRAATYESDLDSILMVVSGALSNLMKLDHLGAILTDSDDGKATVVCWSTSGLLGLNVGSKIELGNLQGNSGVLSGLGADPLGLSTVKKSSNSEDRLWMQVPLGEQSNLLGVLVVSAPIDAVLGEEEADLLQRVANQIAPSIQNVRLTADLTRTLEERRAIAVIGRAASSETEMRSIFAIVAKELDNFIPFDRFIATVADPESDDLDVLYVTGLTFEDRHEGDKVARLNDDELRELRSKRAIIRGKDESGFSSQSILAQAGLQSWLQVALGDLADPIGYLSFRSKIPNAYTSVHIDFLEAITRQIAPSLKNAQMFEMERALRDQLDSQNKELQEANAAKTRFLSTVSHELKTPLTIVSGFIDLLVDDSEQFNEEHMEALTIMRKNASRLGLLIEDVLDISRMDAGKLRIEPSMFLVNELVIEHEKSFIPMLETKSQKLDVSMADSEIWLEADRNRIAQLITNLISNAHKYSGEDALIRLSVAIEDENVSIIIEDEGIGISGEDQKQLFTAFFRSDSRVAREAGGTGLGLVIAKSIAELHGGNLWLNSIENQGTTVAFKIPGINTEPVITKADAEELSMLAQRSNLYPDTNWEDIGDTA